MDPVGPTASDIALLRQEIESIKKRNEEEKKGFSGWTKQWAGILAIIAATFAVPKGAIELYKSVKELNNHPDVQLYMPSAVDWSYVPDQNRLTLQFPFTVVNKGNDYDTVMDVAGKLDTPSNKIPITEFDHTDFNCSETTPPQQISLPFRIGIDSSKAMNCVLSVQLSAEGGRRLMETLKSSSTLRFSMDLKSENKEAHSLKFCFIGDETLEGKIKNPKCLTELGE